MRVGGVILPPEEPGETAADDGSDEAVAAFVVGKNPAGFVFAEVAAFAEGGHECLIRGGGRRM